MSERFRYLPCALHRALSVPAWAKIKDGDLHDGSPYILVGSRLFIDIAHPVGWEHAVRALCTIAQVRVPDSMSIGFMAKRDLGGAHGVLFTAKPAIGSAITAKRFITASDVPDDVYDSEFRREVLCHCICEALKTAGTAVVFDVVFPPGGVS